ncbi:MAG: hypothetical protein ACYS26_00770 [Planctomycetota bacterium]|jgi:hypothetical protein
MALIPTLASLAFSWAWAPQEAAPVESPTPGFTAVLVEAGGAPIDVDLGHAAPVFRDFDGDGLEDLLVGQFGDGLLRVYRNVGRRGAPAFDRFEWFRTQSGPGSIPAG